MRRKYILFFTLMSVLNTVYSQYQAANWPLTYNKLMVKITKDTFEIDTMQHFSTGFLANSSISDSSGNLLCFSFGDEVFDKQAAVMDNGYPMCEPLDSYDSGSCTDDPLFQGVLILPRPGSSSQCYLFLKDMDSTFSNGAQQPMRVTASLIDLNYNSTGKVIQRGVPILWDALSDARMTACQHANGRDWWLVNHQYNTNLIYTHLITPDSIYGPFKQNIGADGLEPDNAGWSLFSPQGNRFATVTGGMGKITLLDFDRCSGLFSNPEYITYSDTEAYLNLAFSPNGRFLYTGSPYYLYQYDLQDSDISQSRVLMVHDTAAYPLLESLVLMPNDKIYMAGWTIMGESLSVIDSPNLKCPSCNFHLRSVYVPGSILIHNVPNFPMYNLGTVAGSGCDTITSIGNEKLIIDNEIRMLPNPTTGWCTLQIISQTKLRSASIWNIVGEKVIPLFANQMISIFRFDVSLLPAGLYFVEATDQDGHVFVKKLLKE